MDKKSNVVVFRWNDNGHVTAASNFEQVEPLDSARRWDKKKKTYINVPRPRMISLYNRYMGNTDVMDQSLACYHPLVRNKKWYWPLFLYCLKLACYNSWILARKLTGEC